MKEPDYENLSLDDLLDVRKHIDREAYPERFGRIEEILNNPQKLKKLNAEKAKDDQVRRKINHEEKIALNGVTVVLLGFLILFFGIGFTRYGQSVTFESTFLRVSFGVGFIVAGFFYFKKHLGKK